jgi:hydrogenase maturation protein HypF
MDPILQSHPLSLSEEVPARRLRVGIQGTVQGVGFRPFVYRLATELGLQGWVLNSLQGVSLEVEGTAETLQAFLRGLQNDKPRIAVIHSLQHSFLDPVGYEGFEIRHSDEGTGAAGAFILPDLATCPDCLAEVLDPANRRFGYPFTNCTNCGPRFSIIEGLPYDRCSTTMRGFGMCPACREEYENPLDRRFHAQPNACPVCGPHVELWDADGNVLAAHGEAVSAAVEAIRSGQILALKGLGGFQLLVDARDQQAVTVLRERKHREEKPLAVMYPTLSLVEADCEVGDLERELLLSPQAPIVLLQRRPEVALAPAIAPGNPTVGVMLPYTPLHHLILSELGFPVVATSGNVSDEPICTDERDAVVRLQGLADVLLVHNRPIARHMDDSVVRVVADRPLVLRRARGYAPLPVILSQDAPKVLAAGAHQKNTTAVAVGKMAFVSQHIGDLETAPALDAFRRVMRDLPALYEQHTELAACDAHPDYVSTQQANQMGVPVVRVQHHVAHVLSCMAENDLEPPVLGIAWDGSGYGGDGTIWGGEALLVESEDVTRVAHFRCFALPGGERAVKEPRRTALGVLHELYEPEAFELMADLPALQAFSTAELAVIAQMLRREVNTPRTSSAGRLFDAVAALAGVRQTVAFEGQAAMELEFLLAGIETEEAYRLEVGEGSPSVVDWQPLVEAVISDVRAGASTALISARFHNALAELIVALALRLGQGRVALSGGCFQNRYLTERTIALCERAGVRPYWHQNLPPNDGGIALGQIVYATNYARR